MRSANLAQSEALIVVDLGYGESGKGAIVDFLSHRLEIDNIIRFTGGANSVHTVHLSAGPVEFCHFGANTRPGAKTHLAHSFVCKPQNLIREARALEAVFGSSPLSRLTFSPECCIATPFHAMLEQCLELLRGDARHGTTGLGIGQVTAERIEDEWLPIRMRDLFDSIALRRKLSANIEHAVSAARQIQSLADENTEIAGVISRFVEDVPAEALLTFYQAFASQFAGALRDDNDVVGSAAVDRHKLIFEGAHGVLTDQKHGFTPYTTKKATTSKLAYNLIGEKLDSVHTIGVMRALAHRHGPGPLVTEDDQLTSQRSADSDAENPWAGPERHGWLDLLTARYAIACDGRIDCVALTMADHAMSLDHYPVCNAYEVRSDLRETARKYFRSEATASGERFHAIKTLAPMVGELGAFLAHVRPVYFDPFADAPASNTADFLNWLPRFIASSEGVGKPVQLMSVGPPRSAKRWLGEAHS